MLRLLMIADDFTGALDTGVQLAAHGIPTQVVVGQADLSACSSTVLVVDTETRHLPAAKAAKALEKAPEDEKLKLAAENAQKAFELAKSGEKIPETFKDFLEKWVYSCEDQPALLDKIGGSRLMRLKNEPHLGYSTTH